MLKVTKEVVATMFPVARRHRLHGYTVIFVDSNEAMVVEAGGGLPTGYKSSNWTSYYDSATWEPVSITIEG